MRVADAYRRARTPVQPLRWTLARLGCVGLIAFTLAACSGGGDTSAADSAPSSEPAGAPCGVITDERLSELTGRSTRVSEPEVGIGAESEVTTCKEEVDGLEPISVRWSFSPTEAPITDLAADGADVLEGGTVEDIELADGFPAALVVGELTGELPTVEVVTVLDGELLDVTVFEMSDDPDNDLLREIAVGVAEEYAAGASEAGAPVEPTPDALPPCDVVSDEVLSGLTGTSQVVTGPQDLGLAQQCGTRRDVEDDVTPTWTLSEAEGSLAESVDQAFSGERGTRIELAGQTPAAFLQSTVAGVPMAQVVTVVDGQLLEVEVADFGADDDPVPVKRLRAVALGIAEVYAGG